MRLVSRMCGSRFGRGVVVPGGVSALPRLAPAETAPRSAGWARQVSGDAAALMGTSSFLDRLRGTGPLTPARARAHGALGPIGKAAGFADDNRLTRPYDGYRTLPVPPARAHTAGDAMARLRVRWEEVDSSFGLLRLAADRIGRTNRRSAPRQLRARRWTGAGLGRGAAGRGALRRRGGRRPDRRMPPPVGVVPQPGADARGVRRRHPDRLPVHRGQLRPLGRRGCPVIPGEAEQ